MKPMLLTKAMLLTSAALLLASPAFADKMVSNPLTPSEYQARVQTLDEKYAALRQQKEHELRDLQLRIDRAREELNKNNSLKIQASSSPALADKMVSNPLTPSEYKGGVLTLDEKYAALRQQKENELAALESRIARAREELAEARNRNNSRKIQAGLPAEIDSAPQKVRLLMERGTIRVWPAPRPFTTVFVGSVDVLDAKVSDAGNADLVISAQEEGSGNIILIDEQGKVIADIQVRVRDPMRREDKKKGS
jgi:Flp pilus assembly secretin CpaC